MTTEESRAWSLLETWLATGAAGSPSAAELCGDCTELLPEVEQCLTEWRLLRRSVSSRLQPTTSQIAMASASAGESSVPIEISDFELREELGRGGMGVVYRALDRERRCFVALKTLQRMNAAAIVRFKREFRALADVKQPNLVNLYEMVSDGKCWFFTMELVEGVDFLRHVRPANVPDYMVLRTSLMQLSEGLIALHQAGKLHCDIKPSNVLVSTKGRVVILDFGLVAERSSSGCGEAIEGQLTGTIAYMAPEQAAQAPPSPASDWYAVGVMLFEALTGRQPFTGRAMQVLQDKQTHDAPAPADLAPGVPADLEELCRELLSRDPSLRPVGSAILARIGAGEAHSLPEDLPIGGLLVGREVQQKALVEALSYARRGRPVVVEVSGVSGMGKSTLVQAFLEGEAHEDGALVLAGKCYEQESVPYKTFDGVVDSLAQWLASLPMAQAEAFLPPETGELALAFPALAAVDAVSAFVSDESNRDDQQALRRRTFSGIRGLLARVARTRPLILSIDDLQWGDIDSIPLLRELLRPPDAPAILLVLGYRREDVGASQVLSSLLEAVRDLDGLERRSVSVEPLEPGDAEKLALAILGDTFGNRRRAGIIARESGGSPFFVWELAQAALVDANEEATLDNVLIRRIAGLPESARLLLTTLAVAGRPLEQMVAFAAADFPPEDLSTLGLLRHRRLVRGTGLALDDRLTLYHDRIRESLLARLASGTKKDRHCRLAEALVATGRADPELLAGHYHGAGEIQQAARCYVEAGRQAATSLAFGHAARLYRLALDLRPPEDQEIRLRAELGDALSNAGLGAESAQEYRRVADGTTGLEALEFRRKAAMQLLNSGRLDEGRAVLREVLIRSGLPLPAGELWSLVSLLAWKFQLRLFGLAYRLRSPGDHSPDELVQVDAYWTATMGLSLTDYLQGAVYQGRHLRQAFCVGEPLRLARALAFEAAHEAALGHFAWTEKLFQVAAEVASHHPGPYLEAFLLLCQGLAAAFHNRHSDSVRLMDQSESILRRECTGVTWETATAQLWVTMSLGMMGCFAELRERFPRLLQAAADRNDLYARTSLTMFALTWVRLADDDPDEVEQRVREAIALCSPAGFHVQRMGAEIGLTMIALYRGEAKTAYRIATDHIQTLRRVGLWRMFPTRVEALTWHSRAALAAAAEAPDPRSLLYQVEADCRALEREKSPTVAARVALLRAGAAMQAGSLREAERGLRVAVVGLDATDQHHYAAAARWRLAECLGGEEGRELRQQAESWMRQQGVMSPSRLVGLMAPGQPENRCEY